MAPPLRSQSGQTAHQLDWQRRTTLLRPQPDTHALMPPLASNAISPAEGGYDYIVGGGGSAGCVLADSAA